MIHIVHNHITLRIIHICVYIQAIFEFSQMCSNNIFIAFLKSLTQQSVKGYASHLIVVSQHLEWASLLAQLVKNSSAMWETWVPSLGWEDALDKGTALRSSILAWRVPWGHKESDTIVSVMFL